MIRNTLAATKLATYSVQLPNQEMKGMPTPLGTGFFVSPDGWFVTAAHVVTQNNQANGPLRTDIGKGWLMKEGPSGTPTGGMCQALTLDYVDPQTDFALIRVDFAANANKAQLVGKDSFPFILVSSKELQDGDPVYSFGYPLPQINFFASNAQFAAGHMGISPRVTSAIVSSTIERSQMLSTTQDTKVYVLDKALNYGNSGGPIVAVESGKVHALCSRFQPVMVPQPHLLDKENKPLAVGIPSLYGIVSSLANETVLNQLRKRNIPISDQ